MFAAERNSTPLVSPLLIRCSSARRRGDAADADAQHEDAHVFDAGVGEHPLEVALPRHEDARQRPSTTAPAIRS